MRMNRRLLVASVLALAVTAGSGVLSSGSVNAAATTVQKNIGHAGGMNEFHSMIDNTELATLLGLTADELKTERKAGKSLATIAAEQSVDVQKVIDLEVTAATTALDKQLANGKITQAQYDTQRASLVTRVTEQINTASLGKNEAKVEKGNKLTGDFGHAGILKDTALAAVLGETTDELETAVQSGKSLATLASEKGITVQTVIDQVTATLTAELDKKLADGTLTQAKYDEQKATISTKATEFVNGTFTGKEAGGGKGESGHQGDHDKKGAGGRATVDGTSGATSTK
ncbi:hypothetical protein [Paenibacillus monticola]|uniref:LysM domain-containing protein n=1 Tax=Paenibacillus monticola TaxID=2666075 RepID=A0A7X2H7V3_9BACL|nr:hypothetical protein [Paenibacillus monticola]MRN55126.1 hypothetical protein [Paenibacillus monticola]